MKKKKKQKQHMHSPHSLILYIHTRQGRKRKTKAQKHKSWRAIFLPPLSRVRPGDDAARLFHTGGPAIWPGGTYRRRPPPPLPYARPPSGCSTTTPQGTASKMEAPSGRA